MSDKSFSIDLRDSLTELTSNVTGIQSYFSEAPKEASYPYIVVNYKRLSSDDGIGLYSVELDLWDKYETYSRISLAADLLDKELDRLILDTKTFNARLYKSNRIPVEDQDKQIKRIQDVFQMTLVERN